MDGLMKVMLNSEVIFARDCKEMEGEGQENMESAPINIAQSLSIWDMRRMGPTLIHVHVYIYSLTSSTHIVH